MTIKPIYAYANVWLIILIILCLYVSKIYLNSCVCVCVQIHKYIVYIHTGFPGGSDGKVSACNGGDLGSIPGWKDPLEKEMAPHSSTLAWKIPWTEKPGGLQSMGLQRIGHD